MDLSNFYKENVHIFYNIDIIEQKYKENCRYKSLSEFSKYLKKEVLKTNNNSELSNDLRDIIKETMYNLFHKRVKKNEISIEQLLDLAKLIDKYNDQLNHVK